MIKVRADDEKEEDGDLELGIRCWIRKGRTAVLFAYGRLGSRYMLYLVPSATMVMIKLFIKFK